MDGKSNRLWWRPVQFELGQPLAPETIEPEPSETGDPTGAISEPAADLLQLERIHGLLLIVTILAVLFTLSIAQQLVVPIVISAFLATALSPPVGWLSRLLPRALSTLLVLMLVIIAVYGLLLLLSGPAQEWAERLPATVKQLAIKARTLLLPLNKLGSGGLMQLDTGTDGPTRISLWGALSATPPILAKIFSVILLTYFFLVFGDRMLRRSVELSPGFARKRSMVAIVRAIQKDTSHYLFITSTINLLLGCVSALALWLLKFPDPLLFGALIALANFIPYVGAFSMFVLLALIGSSQASSLGAGLLPAAVFGLIAGIEGHVLTPAILGQRLSLSPVAIVLWLMIWGWLWGLPGVLLGVPLLMCLKIIVERVDRLRWIARAIE